MNPIEYITLIFLCKSQTHALQKPALFAGISRTYQPKDEEGESLPPESTKVQIKAEEIIHNTVAVLTKLFDITATKDWPTAEQRQTWLSMAKHS